MPHSSGSSPLSSLTQSPPGDARNAIAEIRGVRATIESPSHGAADIKQEDKTERPPAKTFTGIYDPKSLLPRTYMERTVGYSPTLRVTREPVGERKAATKTDRGGKGAAAAGCAPTAGARKKGAVATKGAVAKRGAGGEVERIGLDEQDVLADDDEYVD